MTTIFALPNEILDRMAFFMDSRTASRLLITCRAMSVRLAPAMLLHAVAPKGHTHALLWASGKGHLPLVKRLLPLFPVDLRGDSGGTALHASAWAQNNPLVLECLLTHGAKVNHTNNRGLTALHYACGPTAGTAEAAESAERTVRLLLSHGANANIEGRNPAAVPMTIALYAGFPNVAQVLLDGGADPNWVGSNRSPLSHIPARNGDTEWMRLLLDAGADVDGSDHSGNNPLLLASQSGHLSIVKMLVEKGANLCPIDEELETPLLLAMQYRREDIAIYLSGLPGVDVTSRNITGDTPITSAALLGWDSVLRILLDRGECLVDERDPRGCTALQNAVSKKSEVAVQMLLEGGADVNLLDGRGDTTLLLAVLVQNVDIAKLLMDHGADPANCGDGGLSPLIMASQMGLERMVSLFLTSGMDVNFTDSRGRTALAVAKFEGYKPLADILVAHGAVDGPGGPRWNILGN